MNNRIFGLIMLLLGAALMSFVVSGSLIPAPLLLVFGSLGALGALAMGFWALFGRY
jgi:hypothetical protein